MTEPRTVETMTNTSYLVLPDNELSVYEVMLPGTVASENEQNRNKLVKLVVNEKKWEAANDQSHESNQVCGRYILRASL